MIFIWIWLEVWSGQGSPLVGDDVGLVTGFAVAGVTITDKPDRLMKVTLFLLISPLRLSL